MASDGSFVTNDSGSIVVPDLKSDDSLLLAVERLLNRSNLQTDAYLVSKMKDDMLIPLDVLAQAPGLLSFRESPSSAQELVERLRPLIAKSSQVSLSADQNSVRPNFSIQRHTIIIRDIPSSTPTDEVRNLLPEAHRNKIGNIHSEVGNNWFVSFESEPDAVEALAIIRRSKFNGQTVHARLKAESLLRGTPSVRSAPRPAPGAAPTPSSTAESSTLPTNSNFHTAVPTHSSFYAGGLPPVAKSAAGPSFPQYYPSTPYYQPSSWYYSGASLPIHDSLIPPAATQQFTSPPTPTTGAAAPAPPAHFTSPAFSQTNQSIPAAQPGFESSPQPPHPTTSPRSRPSSTGTQYSSRKPGSSTASGSGPSQPRTKLSSGSSSTAPQTGNVPPAKRRPRNPSPITNSKSGEGGHHTNSSHTSATTKKRNPRAASTSRSEETSNRHSESHSQKPVSLGIRNFPPLGSSTPSTTPPTSSVASSWTKEGVTVVKSIPSSKPSHHQAPPKPAPVQPTPETQSQPTTASPVVTPHTPVTSTTPATAPVTHPSSQPTPPPVTSPVIASPLPFTPTVVTPPLSTPPPVIPSPAQTVQQPNSKPLWASIAAKPPASGQH